MNPEKAILRSGTRQEDRNLAALNPDYVSVEERRESDFIKFAERFAKYLKFYGHDNLPAGDWSHMFEAGAHDIAAYLENPEGFAVYPDADPNTRIAQEERLARLEKPHLGLFLAFLRLLRYPAEDFKALTKRHLDFYYKEVLWLDKRKAEPDYVHLSFRPADGVVGHPIKKGTLLNAGSSPDGKPVLYAVTEEVMVTGAQIASVKTLGISEKNIDLESMRRGSENGFETVLKWTLGQYFKGDDPPPYPLGNVWDKSVDLFFLMDLHEQIKGGGLSSKKGLEVENYVLNRLCFVEMDDFHYCMEIQKRREAQVDFPTQEEWGNVCLFLERAFHKKNRLKRRDVFIRERQTGGMESVFRLALGMPRPEDHLPPMPGADDTFETLYKDLTQQPWESDKFMLAARYVSRDLGMSPGDFKAVMDVELRRKNGRATHADLEKAYDLLVRAEIEKRNLAPPDSGRNDIRFFKHQSIADAKPGAAADIQKFKAFGDAESRSGAEEIDLSLYYNPGFAISSPLLRMTGGERTINVEASCMATHFPMNALKTLHRENRLLFDVFLSGQNGPIHIDPLKEPESVGLEIDMLGQEIVKTHHVNELELLCVAQGASAPISANDYLFLDHGGVRGSDSFLGIWQTIDASESNGTWNLKLRFRGRIKDLWQRQAIKPGAAGFIEIGAAPGQTDLSRAEIIEEKKELRIKNPAAGTRYFDKEDDIGSFIVWSDGGIFQIMEIFEPHRVGAEYLGRIPDYTTDAPKKYGQLDFKRSSAIEQKVVFSGVSARAGDEKRYFTENDAQRLLIFDPGLRLKISRLIPRLKTDAKTGGGPGQEKETLFKMARVETLEPGIPAPMEFNEHKVPVIEKQASYPGFRFKITLGREKPGVLPGPADPPEPGLNPTLPWIKIRLRHMEWSDSTGKYVDLPYEYFSGIKLHDIRLNIGVKSAEDIKIRGESSTLDVKTPFEPFGYSPSKGAAFYFGSPELSEKKIDSMDINIRWQGLPEDLKEHYDAYTQAGVKMVPEKLDAEAFNLGLSLLNHGVWMDIESPRPFFKTNRQGDRHERYDMGFDRAGYDTLDDPGDQETDFGEIDDPLDYPRHFRIQLMDTDFQHTAYPLVMRKIALNGDAGIRDMTVYPPYTPKVGLFSIDYTASAVIDPFSKNYRQGPHRAAHIHPFGCVDIADTVPVGREESGAFFLPPFSGEGDLFVGLRDAGPNQTVSLFFQAVSGTGKAGAGLPVIRLYYRRETGWKPFDPADILDDSTRGFVYSGILRLRLPSDASDSGALMPEGAFWIRISADKNSAAASVIENIKTNGALARFHEHENGGEPLAKALPKNSITGLASPEAAIESADQPYPSFGVRGLEDDLGFYARISERLGHRGRAIALGDYERLALEKFSGIRHAKCLCQGETEGNSASGEITLIVIPDVSSDSGSVELEPGVSVSVLTDIHDYIAPLAPPFAKIRVKNPEYRQVMHRLAVRFNPGFGAGHYAGQIVEDIQRFLSPWAFQSSEKIAFGGVKYRSALIHFLEKLDYVDYVAVVKTFEQRPGSGDYELKYDFIEDGAARCRRADEVLSSSPFHIVDVITSDVFREEDFAGIGYMIIGLDFILKD